MVHIISGRKGSKNVCAVSARAITEQWARNWIYFFQIQIQGSALILNPLIRVCVSRKFTDLRLHIGFLLKLSHPLKQSNAYAWTVRREQGCHVQNSDDEVAGFCETPSVLLVCFFVFLFLFFSPTTFTHFTADLKPSLRRSFVSQACNSCSSLITLLLKAEQALAVVRFWCFLVHSINSGTFCFEQIARRKLYTQKVKFPKVFWHRKRSSQQPERAWWFVLGLH